MKKLFYIAVLSLSLNAHDIPEILGENTRIPTPNQQNTQFYFEHPTFGLIQQREKSATEELKDAGLGLALSIGREIISFEYGKWRNSNPEMEAAQKIEIHNALEQRLENLREEIINTYNFINYAGEVDEAIVNEIKLKISNSLAKVSRKKISLITSYIGYLNGLKAKYDFESKNNLENKNETLKLFINKFQELLTRI